MRIFEIAILFFIFIYLLIYVVFFFCRSWQPESKFPFSQVFLPPKDNGKHTEYVDNQEVEVYARSNEKEACGWWTANIKVLNYNVYTNITNLILSP